ncbi:TPA: 3'-5' exonuclease, partial [Escherichia coli]
LYEAFHVQAGFIESIGLRIDRLQPSQLECTSRERQFIEALITFHGCFQAVLREQGLQTFNAAFQQLGERLNAADSVPPASLAPFQHLLIDEFQDISPQIVQWLQALHRQLARQGSSPSLMAIGDDWQSIYGWRGARIENLHQFSADFPDAETIRLEQNYRSTACILKAANALIANNQGRLGKELWTSGCEGEPISLYAAFNEHDEARYVVESIEKAIRDGMSRSEIAILYRSNAQSRVLEEALLREKIPYRIYGGQRFFERAEIKNAMAYLRLIQTRDNDAALERVINVPARGIGEKTVECLRQL